MLLPGLGRAILSILFILSAWVNGPLAQQPDTVAASDADAANRARGIRAAANPADQAWGISNANSADRTRGIRSPANPADQARGISSANPADGARGIRSSSTYHDGASS